MKSLKGSKTEVNILTAFAGESQARNRYDYFSGVAKKEGLILVSEIFAETACQEKEHAKRLFKFLEGGEVSITGGFPAGIIAGTHDNLVASAAGEHHEYSEMYPSFAKIAEGEGYNEVAAVMRAIAIAEEFHERRFLVLAKQIAECSVFKRPAKVTWRCLNCGCLVEGDHAPATCPACAHPQAYFEVLCNCWN